MTNKRALQLLEIERECVSRGYTCDRNCANCELVQDTGELLEMYAWVMKKLQEDAMIDELNDCIYKVRELFDMAFDYNQNDKFRTELSRKCTDYLVYVEQTLAAIRDKLEEI